LFCIVNDLAVGAVNRRQAASYKPGGRVIAAPIVPYLWGFAVEDSGARVRSEPSLARGRRAITRFVAWGIRQWSDFEISHGGRAVRRL